jgi:hypothetical protein
MGQATATKRALVFQGFPDVIAEAERLHAGGYTKAGKWDLAQVCDHLGYFMESALNGAQYRVPWLLKVLLGQMALRRIFTDRSMRVGMPTPQKPLPAPGGDEAAAVNRFREVAERFDRHSGEYHASPFFGRLTNQQWRDLQLIHCAHHLGFLIPK